MLNNVLLFFKSIFFTALIQKNVIKNEKKTTKRSVSVNPITLLFTTAFDTAKREAVKSPPTSLVSAFPVKKAIITVRSIKIMLEYTAKSKKDLFEKTSKIL